MTLHSEAFYNGDTQTGVLLRDHRPDQLATLIAFTVEGSVYRAEQITTLGEKSTDWEDFRFTESTSGSVTVGVRDQAGSRVNGVLLPGEAVPSYLGWRILTDLAESGGERAQFQQFDEHGDPQVRDAQYVSRGVEAIDLPGLDLEAAHRYDLLLDGKPYTSFWWDGRVVGSDWTAGAFSTLTTGLEQALAHCPVPVAEAARAWVAGRHL